MYRDGSSRSPRRESTIWHETFVRRRHRRSAATKPRGVVGFGKRPYKIGSATPAPAYGTPGWSGRRLSADHAHIPLVGGPQTKNESAPFAGTPSNSNIGPGPYLELSLAAKPVERERRDQQRRSRP